MCVVTRLLVHPLHALQVILGVTLCGFLFTLLTLAVMDKSLRSHQHPGENGELEASKQDIDKDSAYHNRIHLRTSLSQEIVISESAEVICCRDLAAERLTVTDLLDVAQTAGDTLIAVGVECVEVETDTGVAAGVHLTSVQDRLHSTVNDLRCSGAVGVDEVMTLVGLILTLHIAVTERSLDSSLVRLLAAELGDAFLDGSIDRYVDCVHSLGVALRDKYGNGILLRTAVDGNRLLAVEVRETSVDTGNNLGLIRNSHNKNPP